MKGRKGIVCAIALGFCFYMTHAQHEQLWFDYQVDYPFANQYLFEMTTSYQTVLTDEMKWRSVSFTPTFEYLLFPSIDLMFEVPLAYTVQTEGYNSFETIVSLGTRWHITQNRRINTRLNYKIEKRYFLNQETDDWETSVRSRVKAEATIAINAPNLYHDNLWYAILDYEEFFVVDKQLDERYSNRRRARAGLGYRLNYKHRFEFIFTRQSARNQIEGDFITNDNVIQLRYKMYLNPSKPVKETSNIND